MYIIYRNQILINLLQHPRKFGIFFIINDLGIQRKIKKFQSKMFIYPLKLTNDGGVIKTILEFSISPEVPLIGNTVIGKKLNIFEFYVLNSFYFSFGGNAFKIFGRTFITSSKPLGFQNR